MPSGAKEIMLPPAMTQIGKQIRKRQGFLETFKGNEWHGLGAKRTRACAGFQLSMYFAAYHRAILQPNNFRVQTTCNMH